MMAVLFGAVSVRSLFRAVRYRRCRWGRVALRSPGNHLRAIRMTTGQPFRPLHGIARSSGRARERAAVALSDFVQSVLAHVPGAHDGQR